MRIKSSASLVWALIAGALFGSAALVGGAASHPGEPCGSAIARVVGEADIFVTVDGYIGWYHQPCFGTGQSDRLDPGDQFSALSEMAFDSSDDLYVAERLNGEIIKFEGLRTTNEPVRNSFALLPSANPNGLVFDRSGFLYVSLDRTAAPNLLKLDATGQAVESFTVQAEWGKNRSPFESGASIDLGADGCTLFYTSGMQIKRFDVCSATQLPDFANGLTPAAMQIRLFPGETGEEAIVSTRIDLKRLASDGRILKTYKTANVATETFHSVDIDPGGERFWAMGLHTANCHVFEISSGDEVTYSTDGCSDFGGSVLSVLLKAPSLPSEPPRVSVSDARVLEEDGPSQATLQLSLSAASPYPVQVRLSTSNGGASAGSDYRAISDHAVTIPAGRKTADFDIEVLGDQAPEEDEELFVNIRTVSNAVVGRARATVEIKDDDPPVTGELPQVNISDVSVLEQDGPSTAPLQVTLTAPSAQAVDVRLTTSDGTARADSDYRPMSQTTVSIPAGEAAAPLEAYIWGDVVPEDKEEFFIDITGASNARVGKWRALVEIADEDAAAPNYHGNGEGGGISAAQHSSGNQAANHPAEPGSHQSTQLQAEPSKAQATHSHHQTQMEIGQVAVQTASDEGAAAYQSQIQISARSEPALIAERQRQIQIEAARIGQVSGKPQTLLATARGWSGLAYAPLLVSLTAMVLACPAFLTHKDASVLRETARASGLRHVRPPSARRRYEWTS